MARKELPPVGSATKHRGEAAAANPLPALEHIINSHFAKDRLFSGLCALGKLIEGLAKAERIAARYNKTLFSLRQELAQDPSLAMDVEQEQLLFVCSGAAIDPAAVSGAAVNATDTAEPPAEKVFTLHSRCGASKVIYLDFDGHETSGSAWKPTGTIVSPPYDIDGDFSQFSNAELAHIL